MKIKIKKTYSGLLPNWFKKGSTYQVEDIETGADWTNYDFYQIITYINGEKKSFNIGEERFDQIEKIYEKNE